MFVGISPCFCVEYSKHLSEISMNSKSLQLARVNAGLTQGELARMSLLNQSDISRIELGIISIEQVKEQKPEEWGRLLKCLGLAEFESVGLFGRSAASGELIRIS
jgi:transcriptional regulator with XRE-family HTH domain